VGCAAVLEKRSQRYSHLIAVAARKKEKGFKALGTTGGMELIECTKKGMGYDRTQNQRKDQRGILKL